MAIKPSHVFVDTEGLPSLVSLNDVKLHLSLFADTSYDTLLTEYLQSAAQFVGRVVGQPLGATDITVYYRNFERQMELPYGHQDGITSVTYYNSANTLVTVPATDYFVDSSTQFPLVVLTNIPTAALYPYRENPVEIELASASLDTDANRVLQQAILLIVGDWFKYRENASTDSMNQIPVAADRLLQSYKRNLV